MANFWLWQWTYDCGLFLFLDIPQCTTGKIVLAPGYATDLHSLVDGLVVTCLSGRLL